MSQGAIFKLILRDDRFDKFYTASDYLRQRLDDIRVKRAASGENNPQPNFRDIEGSHKMYLRASYRPYVAVASEYTRVKSTGDGACFLGAGGTCQFTFPTFGHFTSDMALHVRIQPFGNPNASDVATSANTVYYRYCAMPGIRMFRKIELRSDALLIDDYDPDDAVAFTKFFIRTDQRLGWLRCIGQQTPKDASFFVADGISNTMQYCDGPQTPKQYQPALEMFVPLQFDFCRDASHSLLNDLIPNSQRTITCEIAPIGDIIQALSFSTLDYGASTPVTLPFSRVAMEIDLYVNGLYVNPEIHDIFASRVGFSLIRVHRRQKTQLQSTSDALLLDQLKYPAEFLLTGFRSREVTNSFDQWWLMGKQPVPVTYDVVNGFSSKTALMGTASYITATPSGDAFIYNAITTQRLVSDTTSLVPIVDTIGVTAHGIEIFPAFSSLFYNAYMPVRYSESSVVVSPIDSSAFLINFCLYPGRFDPSGHYNLSAGREMYLRYNLLESAVSSTGNILGKYEMVVSMSALNFLMRKGDRLVLRYSL